VTVDIPRGMDASGAAAYHIAADGSFERMPGSAGDDGHTYTFTTTHFSKYAIVTPADTTPYAETLTAGSRGWTLQPDTVYTISASTTITGSANQNGLVVSTAAGAANPAVLFIPGGTTLTVRGGSGAGGRAGILLRNGSYLYVRGAGVLDVYGGAGAATGAWNGQSAMRAGGDGWTKEVSGGFDTWPGRGGVSSTGSGGGGAGIGTDGGTGGAAVGVSDTNNVKGHYYWWPSSYAANTVYATGINGAAGGGGGGTSPVGTLYVLDAVRVSGAGGGGGNIESSQARAGTFIDPYQTGYPGGGGGGGGRGGSGALVGSGGGGGGGGGAGGSGGVSPHEENPGSWGGGGTGGRGAVNGLNGAGPRANRGGYGGGGGAAGASGGGGTVVVATSAAFSQPDSSHAVNGKTAIRGDIDVSMNSQYVIGFSGNKPSGATTPGDPTLPSPNPIAVTAGVPYTTALTASLTGWRFTGFYTTAAAVGGVRVIDDTGHFIANAGGGGNIYTTQNGSWCFPADFTVADAGPLYAHWAPGVFTITLQSGAATTPGAATIYEKYDTGWYADAECAGPTIAAIATPERIGYFFEGYYTAPSGLGDLAIDGDGRILSTNHGFPQDTTLYAYWTPVAEQVTVTLRRDDAPYPVRDVALYQSGALRYTLEEKDSPSGVYDYYQNIEENPGYGVVSGDYEVYVDGVATGHNITVWGAPVETEIDMYTATVTTTLDGDSTSVAAVTLRSKAHGSYVLLKWNSSSNNFTAPLYLDTEQDADNVWTVYLDGAASDFELDMGDEGKREVTIPYYNAALELIYDSAWTDAAVTLRQGGAVKYYLPYVSNEQDDLDVKSVYRKAILGDTGADASDDTYDVFVNGIDTGEQLVLTEGGAWTATAEYYEAVVTVLRNGQPWTGADVELWQGGAHAYTLSGDATNYSAPYVQKRGVDAPYDVRVLSGSVSGPTTNETVTEASPTASVSYFDVTYAMTYTSPAGVYVTQIVREDGYAVKPPDPYQAGVTFRGWLTDANQSYDFGAQVTGAFRLHTGFDAPTLIIGGYVRCDDDGTINGATGAYYRMINLSIRGFPLAGRPMSAATLYVTNGAVEFLSEGGYTIRDNLDASGTGTVSILFTGGPGDKVSANTAQQFLREKVVVKVKTQGMQHRLKVSVTGRTN
jgi:hypothetical protein